MKPTQRNETLGTHLDTHLGTNLITNLGAPSLRSFCRKGGKAQLSQSSFGFLSVSFCLFLGIACFPLSSAAFESALLPAGQSFAGSGAMPGLDGASAEPASSAQSPTQSPSNLASNDPASKLCADGTRAIDQGRWADAVKIFTQVASQKGDHADGALYWKAYAENKLGQSKAAVKSCAELRGSYPKSRWIDDCGALEVELHAKSGEPAHIDPSQSDDVKLLALNAMMRQNEPLALAQIQEILNGDSSEKLKKEAQFILGNHYSDSTYAQIVRISYIEGDVRIQRGAPTGKPSSAIWEKAVANLPLETGFSLATGAGRAEIEFEDASTLYLGENSVLTFNDLHETAGIPFAEMGLLSGTVSLYIHPYVAGEKMILHTPTNDFVSRYPDKTNARIEAFTDAVSITPLEGGDLRLPGVPKETVVPGRTFTWQQGQLVAAAGAPSTNVSARWDGWVANRVAERAAAVNSVMEASGLTAPIPGMADMAGKGKFFDCAPYGTCWEPNDQADQDEKGYFEKPDQKMQRGSTQPTLELASYQPAAPINLAGQNAAGTLGEASDLEYHFPCTPVSLLYRTTRDPATGRMVAINGAFADAAPYTWAVCHAGSWIRHKKHYAWVAGGKRRHTDPVRWVKSDHKVGFVPLHPFDVKGRPAINVKHEVFVVNGKNDVALHQERFDESRPIEFLKAPPKEYSLAPLRPLTVAEAPPMEAHPFPARSGAKGSEVAKAAIPIHFDPRSQSFLMARQVMMNGKATTVLAPVSNRNGSLQARAASFSGGSGFHGGSSMSGGSHTSGGGSSSGGGGSHSSGGGFSASSASSSSSAASSASSASSSAHH
jgi:hypothetical protein